MAGLAADGNGDGGGNSAAGMVTAATEEVASVGMNAESAAADAALLNACASGQLHMLRAALEAHHMHASAPALADARATRDKLAKKVKKAKKKAGGSVEAAESGTADVDMAEQVAGSVAVCELGGKK